MRHTVLVFCTLVSWTATIAAAFAASTEPIVPFRATSPPVIDGKLSDSVWEEAPPVTGFKTWRPDFGEVVPAGDRTSVWFAYDAENLYFAFRALDSEADRIKASVAKRDTILSDDWVCINLDSFGDRQSLYAFYINPRGIQADSRYAAGTEDPGFDVVWYSAGSIDADGYTVEVRIPLESIRYGGGDEVRMAVIFERSVSRRSEGSTLPALERATSRATEWRASRAPSRRTSTRGRAWSAGCNLLSHPPGRGTPTVARGKAPTRYR